MGGGGASRMPTYSILFLGISSCPPSRDDWFGFLMKKSFEPIAHRLLSFEIFKVCADTTREKRR